METQANYSTEKSILQSVKKDNWYTFNETAAGVYKKEAIETVIRNLANELGKDTEAEEFLSRNRSYDALKRFYESELEGTVYDFPF